MDKKLKPDVFWAINSNKYDTYMVSSTDRISFKCEDLYRFMEDYAQLRLSAVSGSLDLDSLKKRLDEALSKETPESLREWLKSKRQ
jgi:hypothetical protein